MSPADAVPIALLLLFGAAVGIGGTLVGLAIRWNRQPSTPCRPRSHDFQESFSRTRRLRPPSGQRPAAWLAIRRRNPKEVQAALSLDHPTPCSWLEGLSGENGLFIAPAIRGWVLVTGSGMPDPAEDVDRCFRFLRELSRRLGHVQFFRADRVCHHHAWARVEAGRVLRAYAWAETTMWNQGEVTAEEAELGLKCFRYGEALPPAAWGPSEFLAANVAKVPALAGRWSLDPIELEERLLPPARGIAGRPSVRY
jgi:hypothetical protein